MPKLPLNEFIRLTESNSLISTLTKRELFAAMAMQGLLAANYLEGYTEKNLADSSVLAANALIRELNK